MYKMEKYYYILLLLWCYDNSLFLIFRVAPTPQPQGQRQLPAVLSSGEASARWGRHRCQKRGARFGYETPPIPESKICDSSGEDFRPVEELQRGQPHLHRSAEGVQLPVHAICECHRRRRVIDQCVELCEQVCGLWKQCWFCFCFKCETLLLYIIYVGSCIKFNMFLCLIHVCSFCIRWFVC